jgi:hypothetical protein
MSAGLGECVGAVERGQVRGVAGFDDGDVVRWRV